MKRDLRWRFNITNNTENWIFIGCLYAIHKQNSEMNATEDNDGFEEIAEIVASGDIAGFHPLSSSSESDEERPRKRRNKARDFQDTHRRFERLYFTNNPVYSEADFERRFRIPRRIFERIDRTIRGKGECKDGLKDATGKPGIHPRMKLIAVFVPSPTTILLIQ